MLDDHPYGRTEVTSLVGYTAMLVAAAACVVIWEWKKASILLAAIASITWLIS